MKTWAGLLIVTNRDMHGLAFTMVYRDDYRVLHFERGLLATYDNNRFTQLISQDGKLVRTFDNMDSAINYLEGLL